MKPPFVVELLADHDREEFSCGTAALDRYFKSQVTQDVRRHVTNCFVALEVETAAIAGYYTIAAASIPTPAVPEAVTKKLPRYPSVPAIRVGRLAIDSRFQGKGLGGALLADAAARGLRAEAAAFAMLVDAKDAQAVAFYEHHGFVALESQPRTMFLALATAGKALSAGSGEKKRQRDSALISQSSISKSVKS
ncbi:MAG: GNAT family N-acetyltransferase [Polyangiaceae bacterium]